MPTFSSTHQPTRRGNRRDSSYDLDALHRLLWAKSTGRRHHLELNTRELAAELGLVDRSMRRFVARLVDRGNLRPLGRVGDRGLFVVADPSGP